MLALLSHPLTPCCVLLLNNNKNKKKEGTSTQIHHVLFIHFNHSFKRLFNDLLAQTWTNLTVILADTQSIAINARATDRVAPINDKAPSLLVLLHHHDTQLSRLQIVPSGAPIDEQLLLSEDCTRSHEWALADAGYTRSWPKYCQSLTWHNQTRATINGN